MKTRRQSRWKESLNPYSGRWALLDSRYGLPDGRACAPRPAADPWFSNKGKEMVPPVEPSSQVSFQSLMSTGRGVKSEALSTRRGRDARLGAALGDVVA